MNSKMLLFLEIDYGPHCKVTALQKCGNSEIVKNWSCE